eukprot:GHVS01037659.1.p1 GENE.GHVS01037659.1~~GHVS01037659.1.p1  ORF type:complete len:119 (+),score=8.46 GHVS01037659.1:1-357(+)
MFVVELQTNVPLRVNVIDPIPKPATIMPQLHLKVQQDRYVKGRLLAVGLITFFGFTLRQTELLRERATTKGSLDGFLDVEPLNRTVFEIPDSEGIEVGHYKYLYLPIYIPALKPAESP